MDKNVKTPLLWCFSFVKAGFYTFSPAFYIFFTEGGAMMKREHELFCLEYAKSGNGLQSYKKAYPNCKSTDVVISSNVTRLLKNETIKNRLQELKEEVDSEKIASIREMQETLTAIIRKELQEEVLVVEGCGDGVSETVKKNKTASHNDVIKAVQLLARMQGALDNSNNINVIVPVFGGESDLSD